MYDVDKEKRDAAQWKKKAEARAKLLQRYETNNGVAKSGNRAQVEVEKKIHKQKQTQKKGERVDDDVDGALMEQSDKTEYKSSVESKGERRVADSEDVHPHQNGKSEYNPSTAAKNETDEGDQTEWDKIFEDISSSDDSDLDVVKEDTSTSQLNNTLQRKRRILQKLKDAKKCLDALGVSLVEVEVETTTKQPDETSEQPVSTLDPIGTNKEGDASDDQVAIPSIPSTVIERTLHRQPDEKVAAEMMASLNRLIKASSFIGSNTEPDSSANHDNTIPNNEDTVEANKRLSHEERAFRCRMRKQYHPFSRGGKLHTPNVYYSEEEMERMQHEREGGGVWTLHPSSVGLKHVLFILSVVDSYCRDDQDDDAWDSIFDSDEAAGDEQLGEEELIILRVGMRNRCCITERVLSSLDIEITRTWALTDRATYLTEPAVHFHPADIIIDEQDNETQNEGELGTSGYSEKTYKRLANIEERIAHARIATLLHRSRDDWQKASELVVGYVVSSTPSIGVESYPKLPPVLSLCVLEALLSAEDYIPINVEGNETAKTQPNEETSWFNQYIRHFAGADVDLQTGLLKAIAYSIHVVGRIWKERSLCSDDRIRDVALVELAAYKRLLSLVDSEWLNDTTFHSLDEENVTIVGRKVLSSSLKAFYSTPDNDDEGIKPTSNMYAVSGIWCTLSLLTMGDIDRIVELCEKTLVRLKSTRRLKDGCLALLPACCSAYTCIMKRAWDNMKLLSATGRHTAAAFTVEDRISPLLESAIENVDPSDWSNIDAIVQCCVLIGDGGRLLQLAKSVLPWLTRAVLDRSSVDYVTSTDKRVFVSRLVTAFVDAGEIPTVRVINLKRRPDRLLDFMSYASHEEQMLVLKGPAKMRHKSYLSRKKKTTVETCENGDSSGDYAFDGLCSNDELEDQLANRLEGGKGSLADFVKAKWRPGDLRAFDREARNDSELVRTNVTEKACSLSHIASWMGVEKTLSEANSSNANEVGDDVASWYQQKLIRMFKIAGFARGAALSRENADMEPVPVCVILEDDAVLVDRFVERLQLLLEELPRDFHFCSLGYSRPKSAPLIEYSSQLGIPSCLWYLTGYILSLDGARHLIKSLPVVGPVDSWIGLKMCSNWDNTFGHNIGVGKHTKTHAKLPSRKDLAKILQFRAYAAMVPLCAQKVGTTSTSTMTRATWRDKDTDIVYSG